MECIRLPNLETTQACEKPCLKNAVGEKCSHSVLKCFVGFLSFFVTCLIISNIYLHYQIYKLSSVSSNQRSLPSTRENVKCRCPDHLTLLTARMKRNVNRRGHGRNGTRNWRQNITSELTTLKARTDELTQRVIPGLKEGIMKKVVHLRMSSSMSDSILASPVRDIIGCSEPQGCFRWSDPYMEYETTFDYGRDLVYNSMPVSLKVRAPGIYMVYAQVVVNGPEQGYDPSVGFETVLLRNGATSTLLKTLITQDQKGKRYDEGFGVDNENPLDALNHQGIFKFNCNDQIFVRPISSSSAPRFVYDPKQSHFGMFQINPTEMLLGGNFGCGGRNG